MIHQQIVIIGGGPTGLSLGLELASQNKSVVIFDKAINKNIDKRVLALSYASQQILSKLGAWPKNATAINCVQISHTGFGISNIFAKSLNLEHLGFTVEYCELCSILIKLIEEQILIKVVEAEVTKVIDGDNFVTISYQQDGIEQWLTSDLVIMAEGGSLLQQKELKLSHDYQQEALVTHVRMKETTSAIAYERFAKHGPLVLLPFQDHYILVWSLKIGLSQKLKNDPQRLNEELEYEFTRRLGGSTIIGQISTFPLKLAQAQWRVKKRIILIGNSAQMVHPISAQGLNLGLRDVQVLAHLLGQSQALNFEILRKFDLLRNKDASAVIGFTHALASFVEGNKRYKRHLRGAGIVALSNLSFVQNFIAHSLIFGI